MYNYFDFFILRKELRPNMFRIYSLSLDDKIFV